MVYGFNADVNQDSKNIENITDNIKGMISLLAFETMINDLRKPPSMSTRPMIPVSSQKVR
jgi:hypothetical protein